MNQVNEDKEVQAILQSIRDFHEERVLTSEQAEAIERACERPPIKVHGFASPRKREKAD